MSTKKRILVGVFIIGGVLLFAAGLFLIGTRQQVFSHHYNLYTDFDKVETITTGAKVRVSGMDAGQITDIAVPKTTSSRFRFKLEVDEKFRSIIRQDSVASIESEGMIGAKYVNIQKGSGNSPECPAGCTLPSREPFELTDLMKQGSGIAKSAQSTIDDLHKQSDTAMAHITKLVTHVDDTILASRPDVKTITSNAARASQNVDAVTTSIRQGQGVAGELLADKVAASNVSATLANVKTASANVETASGDAKTATSNIDEATKKVDTITAQLNQAVSSFLKNNDQNQNTARMLRDTVEAANRAATNAQEDTDALKHNFFLRGFFKRRGFFDLNNLTPEKYASTEFVKKPRARVWIPAPGLFSSERDGKQELTEEGRLILRQDMAALVPYLPNNPIMVEGYSSQGAADQQFILSRERADDVRAYLESSYHIDPKFLGAIPLGDHPPHGTGRDQWDGVCLVVVVSK